MRIHAIVLALNEEVFIRPLLDTLYPVCNGISIITQFDRDWYGASVAPDETVARVLQYPDPAGKIHLVVRRSPDEAAARNQEMLSFSKTAHGGIMSHGRAMEDIEKFHGTPDYFWIVDADEMYDEATIPAIFDHLDSLRPRGMRVTGYNYLRDWNHRVPRSVVNFTHFGFLRPGVLFEQRRVVSWNESRLAKGLKMLRLPDWSSSLYGFVSCPEEVGVFHHGCWLGDNGRITSKFNKSSHLESKEWQASSVDKFPTEWIPTIKLPRNIREAVWPNGFLS